MFGNCVFESVKRLLSLIKIEISIGKGLELGMAGKIGRCFILTYGAEAGGTGAGWCIIFIWGKGLVPLRANVSVGTPTKNYPSVKSCWIQKATYSNACIIAAGSSTLPRSH